MASTPAKIAVEARCQAFIGGRIANTSRTSAEANSTERLIALGRNRKSIHQRFASNRWNQISPARFANVNSAKNSAKDLAS